MLRFSLRYYVKYDPRHSAHIKILHIIKNKRTQMKAIPSRLGISFGSDTRPVAFLPRQPIEDDIGVFPEGVDRSFHDDSPIVDFDEHLVTDIAENSSSSPSLVSTTTTKKVDTKTQQIPIAKLESDRLGLPKSLLARLKYYDVHHLTPVQAKMLQRAFLLHDCAVSAETGSGKTYGLCIALIAKLLRNGPNRPQSALFLVPSDILVHQVAKWITELWPYELDTKAIELRGSRRKTENTNNDKKSSNSMTPPIINSIVATIYNSDPTGRTFKRIIQDRLRVPAKIIVSTPEMIWHMYTLKKKKIENVMIRKADDIKEHVQDMVSGGGKNSNAYAAMTGYYKKPKIATHIRAIFPTIDTIVVDEADVLLPSNVIAAPGNLLLAEMTNPIRFKSPVQLLIASATLTPATVAHLRKFLRKNVFANTTSRIFEGDAKEERRHNSVEEGAQFWSKKRTMSGFNSFDLARKKAENVNDSGNNNNNNLGTAEVGATNNSSNKSAPPLQLSENISHRFLAADDETELIRVLIDVSEKFKKEVAFFNEQEATRSEMASKRTTENVAPATPKNSGDKILSTKKSLGHANTKQMFDEDGYAIVTFDDAAVNETGKDLKQEMDAVSESAELTTSDLDEKNNNNSEFVQIKKPSSILPKVLVVYPTELKRGIFPESQNNHNELEQDDTELKNVSNFLEEKGKGLVSVSGGLHTVSQLEEIVGEIFFPLSASDSDANKNKFEVILLSTEQVRGFDEKNIKVVVILARADSVRDFVHWSGRVGRMGQTGEAVHVLSRTWMRHTAMYCERLGIYFKVDKL